MKLSIWKLKKTNHIVLVKNEIIYKGILKEHKITKLDSQNISVEELKKFFSIPYSYIRKIENQKNKNTINIYFGDDSEEDFTFENEKSKNDIFEYLREDSSLYYFVKTPSKFSYAKANFFALASFQLYIFGRFIFQFKLKMERNIKSLEVELQRSQALF